MQIKTALAVYNRPWCIEPQAGIALLSLWEATRAESAGAVFARQQETDSYAIMAALEMRAGGKVRKAPTEIKALNNFSFEGAEVAVIPLTGVVMKEVDFCGYVGTEGLSALIRDAENTKSVKTIVIDIDSPGGAVNAIGVMTAAIKACKKPTMAMVNGMCCSAAYFIASACSMGIWATDSLGMFGSIGTMMSWVDSKDVLTKGGYKIHEYYATASTEKNATFREAEAGKPKKLVEEFLDPINDVFLSAVRSSRAGKLPADEKTVLAGQVFLAADAQAIGLIDGIATAEEIIQKSLSQSSSNPSNKPILKMSTNRFGLLMAALAIASVPVVEGGFLLTEPQLEALEGKLSAQAENPFAAQLTEALKATGELATANARISQLEAELATANAEIVTLGKAPGADFKNVNADADPVLPDANANAIDISKFAHNRSAEEL